MFHITQLLGTNLQQIFVKWWCDLQIPNSRDINPTPCFWWRAEWFQAAWISADIFFIREIHGIENGDFLQDESWG